MKDLRSPFKLSEEPPFIGVAMERGSEMKVPSFRVTIWTLGSAPPGLDVDFYQTCTRGKSLPRVRLFCAGVRGESIKHVKTLLILNHESG